MRRSKILAAVLAASLALSSSTTYAGMPRVVVPGTTFGAGPTGFLWVIFGCSGGIILAAIVASWQQNRQLTWNEAATCGFLFWFTPRQPPR